MKSRCITITNFFPISITDALRFIAFLFHSRLAPATIITYTHAIGHLNTLAGGLNFAKSFLVKNALTGTQRLGAAQAPRLPITLDRLRILLDCVSSSGFDPYDKVLFSAMFALAFYCFLRIGEFTARTSSALSPITFSDLSFLTVSPGIPAFQLSLRHFERNTGRSPFVIVVPAYKNSPRCPVSILQAYLSVRGRHAGPLFCRPDLTPITRSEFSVKLAGFVSSLGWSNIKPHSFRIGAATTASANGVPETLIQQLGRWRSDAFKKYIRVPYLQVCI